jgi:hypothetical protein
MQEFYDAVLQQFCLLSQCWVMIVFPGQKLRKHNSVKSESAVLSFFTDDNLDVHHTL